MTAQSQPIELASNSPFADPAVGNSLQTQSHQQNGNGATVSRGSSDAPPAYSEIHGNRSPGGRDSKSPLGLEADSLDFTAVPAPRPEDKSAVGQLLNWIPPVIRMPRERMPPLEKPVVIPQLEMPPTGHAVPFMRCYSPVLEAHDIPRDEFLAFLDHLALAQNPNVGSQAVNLLGAGVGFLPIPLFHLAGKGISVAATSTSEHFGSRVKLYMIRTIHEYMGPRNLKISIVRDEDIGKRLGVPWGHPHLEPLTQNTLLDSICKRRFDSLAPYASPLEFNVPAKTSKERTIDKLVRKHRDYRMGRDQDRLLKTRDEQFKARMVSVAGGGASMEKFARKMEDLRVEEDEITDNTEKDMAAAQDDPQKLEKIERKHQEKMQKLQEKQTELQRRMSGKAPMAVGNANEAEGKERALAGRLKWILIENL